MKKKFILLFIVMAVLCCGCGASYECSKCKDKVSEAYYDPFGSYEYLCENCAKSYFAPMPYTSYKVE